MNELYEIITPVRRGSHNKGLLGEVWDYLKIRKKWWLAPIIIFLIAAGLLIVFGGSTWLSPFIYALG